MFIASNDGQLCCHCNDSVEICFDENIDAYLADGNFRKRDPRFIDRDRYQPKNTKTKWFKTENFDYDPTTHRCRCPAGNEMWSSGKRTIDGNEYVSFTGYLNKCGACPLQKQSMRHPVNACGRQVSIKLGRKVNARLSSIDSDQGRHIYSKRLGTIEPVFGNVNTIKRLTDLIYEVKPR